MTSWLQSKSPSQPNCWWLQKMSPAQSMWPLQTIWPTHDTCPLQIISLLQMMSPAQKMLPAQSIWPVHLIMPLQTMSPLQRMSPLQKKPPSWTMLPSQKMWPPAHSPSAWLCYSHVPRWAAPVLSIYFCERFDFFLPGCTVLSGGQPRGNHQWWNHPREEKSATSLGLCRPSAVFFSCPRVVGRGSQMSWLFCTSGCRASNASPQARSSQNNLHILTPSLLLRCITRSKCLSSLINQALQISVKPGPVCVVDFDRVLGHNGVERNIDNTCHSREFFIAGSITSSKLSHGTSIRKRPKLETEFYLLSQVAIGFLVWDLVPWRDSGLTMTVVWSERPWSAGGPVSSWQKTCKSVSIRSRAYIDQ